MNDVADFRRAYREQKLDAAVRRLWRTAGWVGAIVGGGALTGWLS